MARTSVCRDCGQKLRVEWNRCPYCRVLLAEQRAHAEPSPAPPVAAEAEPALRPWLINGGLLVAAAVGVGMFLSGSPEQAAAKESVVPVRRTERQRTEPTVRTTDPVAVASHKAENAVRTGNLAYSQGNFAGALSDYEAAVAADGENAGARNNLGQVLVRTGRPAEAVPHFGEAIRLDPTQWSYRFNRARAYGLLNRWKDAVADYRAAITLFPEDHATHFNLGLALMQLRDYAGAVVALERAVQLAPEEHDFLITLGTAYVGAEQLSRAREVFQKFLEVAPSDREAARVTALLASMDAASQQER